jgi:hypothetical protein
MRKGLQWIGLLVLCLATSAAADEGMWPFNTVPKTKIKAKYGFEPSQAWLDHLRLSSVRMGDSGSFVSPNGLILTNHHVARRCVIAASTNENDLMKTGFYAKSHAEEIKCHDFEVEVLQEIEDVTAKVFSISASSAKTTAATNARNSVVDRIAKQCSKGELYCEVIPLYAGAIYHLYKYKKYSDVRLVFVPEAQIAFFGGDPDNYTFPRHDLDIAFLRVYEHGQEIHSSNYLRFSNAGSHEGDLVFASGNPGSTKRLTTLAQMLFLRDVVNSTQIKSLKRRARLLKEFSEESQENARMVESMLWDVENRLKALEGYQAGLLDKESLAKKAAEEQKLRAAVAADAKLKAKYGDPWAEIERAIANRRMLDSEKICPESVGLTGRLATFARILVRAPAERGKRNALRLAEFQAASWPMQERDLLRSTPIDKATEEITLTDSLSQLVDETGADNALAQRVLGGETPASRAHELISQTKLDDVAVRRSLLEGGQAAIDASTDPFIVLQRAIDADARALRKRAVGHRADADLISIRVAVGEATFATTGTTRAPDATGNLRLSFGVIKGSNQLPPFTSMGAAFTYADVKGNKSPYELPESWTRSRSRINPETPLNFVSTVDVIGGNSGSPLVNTSGDLVGVVFDANQAMLAGQYVYQDSEARAIIVDSRAILEALQNIYDAIPLLDEITRGEARTQ